MKNRFYILLLLLLAPCIKVFAQPMPPACTDSWERYVVPRSLEFSYINWTINKGASEKIIHMNGDTVDIHWGGTPGFYKIYFNEVSNYPFEGVTQCVGELDSAIIHVVGAPINIGADQELCYGQTYEFDAGDGFSTYKWNNNDTLNTRYFSGVATKTDTIIVAVESNINCKNADTAILLVRPLPVVKITADGKVFRDTMLCGAETITLDAGYQHTFFSWNTGELSETINVDALSPSSHDTAKILQVTAANEYGCESKDSVYVLRCQPPDGNNIPTVFTPNGDQWNQTWKIPMLQYYPDATVDVYDRWGRLVFHSDHGYQKEWDGSANGNSLPMDNYFYIIKLEKNSKQIVGNVLILR